MMEIDFEKKEEMLESIKNTKKPIMVGVVTGFTNDNFVSKTVKLSCVDSYGDMPVLTSHSIYIGRFHSQNTEALQKLEKVTEGKKEEVKAELEEKGFKVLYGNWVTPEL